MPSDFVVASCYRPEVLEAAERALDNVGFLYARLLNLWRVTLLDLLEMMGFALRSTMSARTPSPL